MRLRLCMSFWGVAITEYHKEELKIMDLFFHNLEAKNLKSGC